MLLIFIIRLFLRGNSGIISIQPVNGLGLHFFVINCPAVLVWEQDGGI